MLLKVLPFKVIIGLFKNKASKDVFPPDQPIVSITILCSVNLSKNLNFLLEKSDQKIDLVFFLNVNKETIIERIKRRRIEEQRSDDDLDTIVKRYDTYMKTTRPVLDFYSKNINFHEIDGSLEIKQITNKISNFINF